MVGETACLDAAGAARFLLGDMTTSLLETVRSHLERCDACLTKVAFAVSTDDFSQAQRTSPDFHANLLSWLDGPRPDQDGATLSPGAEVGPYIVQGVLGQGGMGVVYRARHGVSGQLVALKTVSGPLLASYEGLRDEIALLEHARHPGVVEILEANAESRDPWYAMELLSGETLAARNAHLWPQGRDAANGGLPEVANGCLAEVLSLFEELCLPLDFVHRTGIVHGDLKPSNVFLRDGRVPVLMDFGLGVRASGAIGRESLAFSRPRGTLPYMSPESLEGRVVDARADLYALGCMLYESLTGQPPFSFRNRERLIDAQIHELPALASTRVAGVPPELDELLVRLLAKDPRQRIGHAESIASVLATLGTKRPATISLPPPTHLLRPTMVGRADALETVLAALQDARAGRGSLLFVEGESGIGKTFLVSEVAQRASLRGMRIVLGQCVGAAPDQGSADVSGDALHPFQRCFEAIRDECRAGGEEAIERLFGDGLGVLAPYFSAVAELAAAEDVPSPLSLPEAAGRERVLEAMTRSLRAFFSTTPTLLVLDDLQWADELSLSVVERLIAPGLDQHPLLLLATRRTDEGNEGLNRLALRSDATRVRLERLDEAAVASMTAQMLGISESPETLARFVFVQSEGVPFFVAEYLRSAQVDGALEWTRGTWHLSSSADPKQADALTRVSFPARLQGLVRRRLRGSSVETMRLLETAAVAGREFDLDIVSQVLGLERTAADLLLLGVVRRYIVEWTESGLPRFSHDKFRETIYADIDAERRVGLHRSIADAIERSYVDHPEFHRWYGELARHLRLAGEPARAVSYLEKAGNRALQISADAEAVAFLSEALKSESTLSQRYSPERRALWECGVADAKHGLGQHAGGMVHLGSAAQLLGHAIPASSAGVALQIGLELFRQVLHRMVPGYAAWRSRRAKSLAIEAQVGEVFERLHRTSYFSGNTLHLMLSCIKSLNYCETAGVGPLLAKAYSNAAAVCSVLPAHRLAEDYLDRAQAVIDAHPDPVVETAVLLVQGVYHLGVGQHDRAIAYTEQGMGLAEVLSFGRRRDECLILRSAVDIYAGRAAKLGAPVALLEASARARNDAHALAWAFNQRLEALVIRGDIDEGARFSQKIQAHLEESPWPEQIWGFGLGAYLAYRKGDYGRALELARRVGTLSRGKPPVYMQCVDAYDRLVETWLGLAGLCKSLSLDVREVRRQTRAMLDMLTGLAQRFPIARPALALHSGTIAWQKGRRAQALRKWREGVSSAQAMKLEFPEARLLAAIGTARGDDPVEGARALERSHSLLEELQLSRASLPPSALDFPALPPALHAPI